MKNYLSLNKRISTHFYSALSLLFISVFLLMGNSVMGQKDTTKLSVSMTVSCKTSDGVKQVKVVATHKVEKKFLPVDNAKSPVKLYLNEVQDADATTGEGLLGTLYLDDDGIAVFDMPANFNSLTSKLHEFTFIAQMEKDPIYEDTQEEITVADAKITIEYSGTDSIKTATATLVAWNDSAYAPVADEELRLFIKRTFSLFPFGEEGLMTDSLGQITCEVPLDMPGEADGTIILVGGVLDHDTYGTVQNSKAVKWNVLPKKNEEMGRTLWSTGGNAPIALVAVSCSIIFIIWGTIIYLILQLFKIRKIGKQKL